MLDSAEHVPGDDSRQARTYLDIVGFMVVAIDADQKVSFVNGRCCELLGYSSKEDILGKSWFDVFLPDEIREGARAAFADLMAGGTETVPGCELPVLTRHGQEKVISWQQVVLRDERGRIVGVLGSGEDVTERKLAERMVSRLTDDLAERVKEVKCLYSVSNAVQGQEGSEEEERLQSVVDLVPSGWHHPENTCARLTIGDRVFATQNFRDTVWKLTCGITAHQQPIGALEVCLLELRTEEDDRPQLEEEEDLIKAVAEQIGRTIEVGQATQALQDSEKKYRELVENLHEGIWAIDGDACTSFVSSRMAEMLGYSPEEMLGRHLF